MERIDTSKPILTQYHRTPKELIHALSGHCSTLNRDISLTQKMPTILPGERGVRDFVEALRENYFPGIANAIEVVHVGWRRAKKGKNFPNKQAEEAFRTASGVLRDMSCAVGENTGLLNQFIKVPDNHYRGEDTRVGELVLTFYEFSLQYGSEDYPANQRTRTLSRLQNFSLSPLMRRAIIQG